MKRSEGDWYYLSDTERHEVMERDNDQETLFLRSCYGDGIVLSAAESLSLFRFLGALLPSTAAAAQAEQEADWLDIIDCKTCHSCQGEVYDACQEYMDDRPRVIPAYCDIAAPLLRQYADRNRLTPVSA
jgi:hypothetical protein